MKRKSSAAFLQEMKKKQSNFKNLPTMKKTSATFLDGMKRNGKQIQNHCEGPVKVIFF